MAEGGERVVVYFLCCIADGDYHWYGVELPTEQRAPGPFSVPKTLPSKKISPVATLRGFSHGSEGSWTVIGDDIYWVGGIKDLREGMALCKHLLRHNVKYHAADPSYWETVSPPMKIPRMCRFLAAVGTKKLCVVGGQDYRGVGGPYPNDADHRWRHCGEIYDLENDTWTYLESDYKPFIRYPRTQTQVAVEENNDGVPTRIVFFSVEDGSVMTLDVPSCTVAGPDKCANLDLWKGPSVCSELFITGHVRPAYTDGMLYWLNQDLHLCAYHIVDQTWLLSPPLQGQLPSPMEFSDPIVVAMGKEGRLLVVLSPPPEQLTVASLTVTRSGLSLIVSVDVVQPLTLDRPDTYPMLLDGKSIHGAYQLPPPDRIGRAVELRQTGPPDVVLYIHGALAARRDLWYRVDLETKRDVDKSVFLRPPRPRPYKKLSAVAFGHSNKPLRSWTVIDDNIYLYKGKHLLKRDMNHTDLRLWEIESTPKDFPDEMPFLSAFGTSKQCILTGTCQPPSHDGDHCSYWCGIYDLDEKTWIYSTAKFDITIKQATLVEKDGPTNIVLYSLDTGSVYFLDVTSGKLIVDAAHPDFALLQHSEQKPPPGLSHDVVLRLQCVAKEVPAVFTNDTFYWFAPDLCLYGYDVNAKIWFQSPSLEDQLPSLETFPLSRYILVGLGNGCFLVIVRNYPGELTVLTLTVDKRKKNLSVSVDSVQPLYVDDDYFEPLDGKAMLKQDKQRISIQPTPLVQAPFDPMLGLEADSSKETDGGSQTAAKLLSSGVIGLEEKLCSVVFPSDQVLNGAQTVSLGLLAPGSSSKCEQTSKAPKCSIWTRQQTRSLQSRLEDQVVDRGDQGLGWIANAFPGGSSRQIS